MKRERTIGDRIRTSLLKFCFFEFVAFDCGLIYLLAIHRQPRLHVVPFLLFYLFMTGMTYRSLRRRRPNLPQAIANSREPTRIDPN